MEFEVTKRSRSWGLSVWSDSDSPDYEGTWSTVEDKLRKDCHYQSFLNTRLSAPAVFFKGRKVLRVTTITGEILTCPVHIRQWMQFVVSVETV